LVQLLMSDLLRAVIAGMAFYAVARGLTKYLMIYEILMTVSFLIVVSSVWMVGDIEGFVQILLWFSCIGAAIIFAIIFNIKAREI